MIRRIALALTAALLLGCQHVTVTNSAGVVTKSQSFGAGSTTVAPDGTVTTESPGLSEGVGGIVRYALSVAATFFHATPQERVIIAGPTCEE